VVRIAEPARPHGATVDGVKFGHQGLAKEIHRARRLRRQAGWLIALARRHRSPGHISPRDACTTHTRGN
jgi:hypothetical protein